MLKIFEALVNSEYGNNEEIVTIDLQKEAEALTEEIAKFSSYAETYMQAQGIDVNNTVDLLVAFDSLSSDEDKFQEFLEGYENYTYTADNTVAALFEQQYGYSLADFAERAINDNTPASSLAGEFNDDFADCDFSAAAAE